MMMMMIMVMMIILQWGRGIHYQKSQYGIMLISAYRIILDFNGSLYSPSRVRTDFVLHSCRLTFQGT